MRVVQYHKDLLVAKAQGISSAIGGMATHQLLQPVTKAFADDYNNLRALVIQADPSLEEISPPKIEYFESNQGYFGHVVKANYQDIFSYAKQIFGFLTSAK